MLASQHHAGSRVLGVSTIRGLSHARVLSTLIIGTTSIGRLPRECPSSPVVSRRNFWWGRNRSRHWATLLGAHDYYKHCKTRYGVSKDKSVKPPYRNSILNWDHPLNQYRPSQGWRLASSWDKPGGRWVKSDPTPEDKNKAQEPTDEWYREYERLQVEMASRLELFKKQIEKDPYGMLFGKAIERSINPWASLNWLTTPNAEKGGVSRGETSTKSPSPDGDEAEPSTKRAVISNETLGQTAARDQQFEGAPRTQSTINQHVPDSTEPGSSLKKANDPIILEDYEIDPITLRKVHRIHKESRPSGAKATSYDAHDIPVKTFEDGVSRSFLLDRSNDKTIAAEDTAIEPSNEVKPLTSSNIDNKGDPTHTSGKTWLAQEGFGERPPVIADKLSSQIPNSVKAETSSSAKASTSRLENSLDRYLRNADEEAKPGNCGKAIGKPLEYKAGDPKPEDVDLHWRRIVMASYGHTAKSERETDAEKQARRHKIEADYQERRQNLENQYTEELAAEEAREATTKREPPKSDLRHGSTPQDLEASFLNEISIQEPSVTRTDTDFSDFSAEIPEASYQREMDASVQREENSYGRELEAASTPIPPNKNNFMNNMKAQLWEAGVKYSKELKRGVDYAHEAFLRMDNNLSSSLTRDRKREAAEKALVEEVKVQKLAMEGIENRNMLDSSKTASSVQDLHRGEGDMSANVHEFGERGRWYKNKAPHAVRDEAQKLRDRDLIREITGIYEDSYGTIDTKHRQVPDSRTSKEVKKWAKQLRVMRKELKCSSKKYRGALMSIDTKHRQPGSKRIAKINEWNERLRVMHKELQDFKARYWVSVMFAKDRKDYGLKPVERVGSSSGDVVMPREGSKSPVSSPTCPKSASPAPPAPPRAHSTPVPPTLYKVLAHDPLAGKVSVATTTSSVTSPEEAPTSVSEALLRLSSPAQFLPHFSALRQAGYDIVSGSADMLVFKKFRDTGLAPDKEDAAVEDSATAVASDPIRGNRIRTRTSASRKRPHSSLDSMVSRPEKGPTPLFRLPNPLPAIGFRPHAKPTNRVRRQETVFSGSRRWRPEEKSGATVRPEGFWGRMKRNAKRLIWVGAWTAGCCYAVGVVAEYFVTGGAEGLGPQGF